MSKRDFYEILGVNKNSDDAEIKKAYRTLAKQFHPDSTGGDKAKETRFKDISSAYDVLGDAKKRQRYDAEKSGRGPGRRRRVDRSLSVNPNENRRW